LTYLGFAYRSVKKLEACFELAFDLGYVNKNIYDKILHDLESLEVKFYKFMCVIENNGKFKKRSSTNFYSFEKFKIDSNFSENN